MGELTAMQIAAGEVVDRPVSIARELIDNSIDALATKIRISIEEGGIKSLVVEDNGVGMSTKTLSRLGAQHVTSKLSLLEDLAHCYTLGFRGEALSSICACSRVEVLTAQQNEKFYKVLRIHAGFVAEKAHESDLPSQHGTKVSCSDLFYSIPARRKFLKRPATEAALVKNIVALKALAFPEISFSFVIDGKSEMSLPPCSFKERVSQLYPGKFPIAMLYAAHNDEESFSLDIVAASPDLHFKTRRYMTLLVNGRPVDDFSLLQAMEYGYGEVLPGSSYPAVFVSLYVDPAQADFNIHPAKKEVRLQEGPLIHRAVVHMIKDLISQMDLRLPKLSDSLLEGSSFPSFAQLFNPHKSAASSSDFPSGGAPVPLSSNEPAAQGPFETQIPHRSSRPLERAEHHYDFRYVGQVFSLFLIVERGESLYLLDQHAAHERLLYDELLEAPLESQKLLVPVVLYLSSAEELLLNEEQDAYAELGIDIKKVEAGKWELSKAPSVAVKHLGPLLEHIKTQKGDAQELRRSLLANVVCKNAVKQGETLTQEGACSLIEKAFALPSPFCPHGRPLWIELTKERLLSLIGRSV